ncbi:serine phosphatase RsbU, regulator of sigma subunit [Terrimicrobium sacchariphilum]|uniref:histidine kinase n=1 Tax=Terrimicrobium sacchariphilum TaxID=690879 RepID=A0A146G5W7_TERSA|nr:SpoIIE family protein phosphatase [Terrimicrobium sacchariphilum]GAT33145.1 serine phosphatase RsbU, regulator of sigma subunit [Terrimicrobium sacchariphilum]
MPEFDKASLSKLRHDLRTPINHIIGYGELLREDLVDQGITELSDLQRIEDAARRLLEMITESLSDDAPSPRPPALITAQDESIPVDSVTPPAITGHLLIVDDNAENSHLLARTLERQGHRTSEVQNGLEALALLAEKPFDVVLLDVLMPELDGYETLGRIKADPNLRHIPVIMISALDELKSVVRCIEAGAEDYLPKPFDPTLLRARVGACLEKKRFRDQEQAYLEQIDETRKRLQSELQEAARYVSSILPEPTDDPFHIRWAYNPSTELGGDSFGYHWIDEDHFAIYLLDVCGHGVGAALLSVAAINVMRTMSLQNVDFREPAEVLRGLNDTFPMERHNNMYFTIWYGVYHKGTARLRHTSGGHPPAVLFVPGEDAPRLLRSPGMLIGAMPGATFHSEDTQVPPGSRLCVFCDGAYEIRREKEEMLDFETEFLPFLNSHRASEKLPDELLTWIRSFSRQEALDDDYSFLTIDFPA